MNAIHKITLIFLLVCAAGSANCQQDINLYITDHYLSGKKIIKIYKKINSSYVWALGSNNQLFKINQSTGAIEDFSNQLAAFAELQFIDIVSSDDQTTFVASNKSEIIILRNGTTSELGPVDGIIGNINSIGLFLKSNYFAYGNANLLRIGTDKGWGSYDIDLNNLTFYPDSEPGLIYELNYRMGIYQNSVGHASANPDMVPIDIHASSVVTPLTIVNGYIWRNSKYGQPLTASYSFPNLYQADDAESNLIYLFWGSDQGLFENQLFEASNQAQIKQYLNGIRVNKINNLYGLTNLGSKNYKCNLLAGTSTGLYFSSSTTKAGAVPVNLTFTHLDQLGNIGVNDIGISISTVTHISPLADCEDAAWLATDDGVYCVKPDYSVDTTMQISAITFKNQLKTVDTITACSINNVAAQIDTSVIFENNVQWFKNGNALTQENRSFLSITAPGDYYAVLYDPCANLHIQTNHLTVQIMPLPKFAFNYPDQIKTCAGLTDTLKVISAQNYHYRWYKDNVLTGDTLAALNITKTGSYKVEASACAGLWVPSKTVQVDFIKVPTPAIKPDKPAYCIGDNATLSVNVPLDTAYSINWYRDNSLIVADQNATSITTAIPGNYIVTVTGNQLNCSQFSTVQPLRFNPPPTVAIQKIIKTTLCDGQTVDLKVSYTGGTVQWSTGQSTDQIGVTASGTYKAVITSPAGCIADTSIDVQFLPTPTLNIKDTSLCTFTKQTIELSAPPGLAAYSWNNGISSDQTYSVTTPQTVSLTVTDANGCQSTQQIVIANQCPEVHIPNTFTPNGDGMNDRWVIGGLENDATASVRVYNRYGNLLYESKGYGSPWDGTYKGSKLPPGVYYYTINAKNNKQKFSGSVTIIY